jgi:hypothetical protein
MISVMLLSHLLIIVSCGDFRLTNVVGNIFSCNVLLPEGIKYMKEITYMSDSYLSHHLMPIEILNELLFENLYYLTIFSISPFY